MVCRVISHAFPFWEEPAKQPVVVLVCPLVARAVRARIAETQRAPFFQFGEACELAPVVRREGSEHLVEAACKQLVPYDAKGFHDERTSFGWELWDQGAARLALDHGQESLVAATLPQHKIALPMPELLALLYGRIPFLNAAPQLLLPLARPMTLVPAPHAERQFDALDWVKQPKCDIVVKRFRADHL